eukprot:tig00000319_g24135.t1
MIRRRPHADVSVLDDVHDDASSHRTTDPEISSDESPPPTPRADTPAGATQLRDSSASLSELTPRDLTSKVNPADYWLSDSRKLPQHLFWQAVADQVIQERSESQRQLVAPEDGGHSSRTRILLDSGSPWPAPGRAPQAQPPPQPNRQQEAPRTPRQSSARAAEAAGEGGAARGAWQGAMYRPEPPKKDAAVPSPAPRSPTTPSARTGRGSPRSLGGPRPRSAIRGHERAEQEGVCACSCFRAGRSGTPPASPPLLERLLGCVPFWRPGGDLEGAEGGPAARPRAGQGSEGGAGHAAVLDADLHEGVISRLAGEVELLRTRVDRLSAETAFLARPGPPGLPAPPSSATRASPRDPPPPHPERAARLDPSAPVVGRAVRVVGGHGAGAFRGGHAPEPLGVAWFRRSPAAQTSPIAGASGACYTPTADDVGCMLIAVVGSGGQSGAEAARVESEPVALDGRSREQLDALVRARRAVFWCSGAGRQLFEISRSCPSPPPDSAFSGSAEERCTLFVQPACITLAHNNSKRELIARRAATIDLHPSDPCCFSLFVYGPPLPSSGTPGPSPEPIAVTLRLSSPSDRDILALCVRKFMAMPPGPV